MSSIDMKSQGDELPVLRIQKRLLQLGYDLGKSGPNRDGVDGDIGDLSQLAILAALETGKRASSPSPAPTAAPAIFVPSAWMPPARMNRIIVHWTAGSHVPSELDRQHYHVLIGGMGQIVKGIPSIALNDAGGVKSGYAAHTLNCNTGSIGVSLCCMAGAIESPFSSGAAPMTPAQWDALPGVLRDLCWRYGIKVTPQTVLSHAEVQATLGIQQRGKWDVSRLSFDPSIKGAREVGDLFRQRTAGLLAIT